MAVAIITGSGGVVGVEAARHFAALGLDIVGVDNDLRAHFFGSAASTAASVRRLEQELGPRYRHRALDIRDRDSVQGVLAEFGANVTLIVHAAAQPSHDWAAGDPMTDFSVNATGTLHLLEAARAHCPDAVFIFTSTNKVYGDRPNALPLVENETRLELPADHPYFGGVDEEMSLDQTLHSLFGVSKAAADLMVQEYGRYFGMRTGIFRGGCLTGPAQAGAALHGFLGYLMKCAVTGTEYTVLGYNGKQVRDNLHTADLARAFEAFWRAPRPGEVYNMGGGRVSNCSMLEAIALCEKISGKKLKWNYRDEARRGDHRWWISGLQKFQSHYSGWQPTRGTQEILTEIYEGNRKAWGA